MTILVDMDDVLEQLLKGICRYNAEHYGTTVQAEDITDWEIVKFYPGMTRAEVMACEMDDEFWQTVDPMPGADEALRKMIADGHEVFIVTATLYQTLRSKMDDLLFRCFPYITWDRVITTCHKDMIKGDVLIDDGPHNLTRGEYRKILFEAPHNRSFDESSIGAVRVKNWEEAYEEVCRIAAEIKNGQ